MGSSEFRSIRAALAALLILITLAGCAGRPSEGVEIVVWQEQQRQRLEAQGFPQYGRD